MPTVSVYDMTGKETGKEFFEFLHTRFLSFSFFISFFIFLFKIPVDCFVHCTPQPRYHILESSVCFFKRSGSFALLSPLL